MLPTHIQKLLTIVTLFSTAAFSATLSLQEALDCALGSHPAIKRTEQVVEQKKAAQRAAWANFTPTLQVTGNYMHMDAPLEFDLSDVRDLLIAMQASTQTELTNLYTLQQYGVPLTDMQKAQTYQQTASALDEQIGLSSINLKSQKYRTASFIAAQPLFMGGKLVAAQKAAKAKTSVATHENEKRTNEIVQTTLNQYITLLLVDQVIETRKNVLQGMQQHERAALSLFEQGLITKDQLLRAKVAVADAEKNLTTDQNTRDLVDFALRQTLGLDETTVLTPADSLTFRTLHQNVDYFIAHADTSQPILKLLQANKNLAKQNRNALRADFMPQILGVGRYEMIPEDLSALEPRWVVGVQAQLTLSHGFKKHNELAEAKHLQREIEYAQQEVEQNIELWIMNSYKKLNSSSEQYRQMATNVNLATECLTFSQKRFAAGTGTSLEVIDAQLVLEKNLLERLNVLAEYYMAGIELYTAVGQPENFITLWSQSNN